MQHTTIAVDVAKSVFEIAVSHRPGRVAARHRLTRPRFARFLAEQRPATVVMEACGMAHYWGREAQARGHRVRRLPPRDVRPYVRGNKTDRSDAKGLLEANRNEAIRPVPVKSVEQHALAGLHRMRSSWVAARTARLNTIRGLLRELGVVVPVGARQVVPRVWELVSDAESGLPDALRPALADAAREVVGLERQPPLLQGTWIGEVELQERVEGWCDLIADGTANADNHEATMRWVAQVDRIAVRPEQKVREEVVSRIAGVIHVGWIGKFLRYQLDPLEGPELDGNGIRPIILCSVCPEVEVPHRFGELNTATLFECRDFRRGNTRARSHA